MVMANPVQGKLWGSEMSFERAQNREKDGGAHESPHETSFDDGILYLSKESPSPNVREITDTNSLQELVQDGGTVSLLAGDGEDMVDIYPYDQSVGDKAEWMKSNCKSLSIDFDGVGEENVGDILGLGSESKVDNLMTIGGQFLSGGIAEDSGIILCSDGVSLSASSISAGNEDKCSDIIPLCNMPDDIGCRTDQVLCPTPSSQNNENGSNLLLGSTSATVSSVFGDLPTSLDASNISFTTYDSKESQKGETVEELAQTNEISLLETSFPSLTSSSQSLLGTCTIAPSVSDSGLTGGILPNFLGIDSLSTSPGNETCVISEGNAIVSENFQQNVLLNGQDTSDLTNVAVAASDNSTKIDLSDPSNVTLAMISVSTDKDGNSTQIVLNTSEGQQLYMFNTASLNQVSNCVVPVAQPVENVTAVQGITSVPAPGSPNQYILLPVVNGTLGSSIGEGSLVQQEESEARDKLTCPEPGCGKTFSKMAKLKIHTMQHTGERPFKCSKEGCDWAFTTAYKLKRHEESHEGKKDFYCDYEGCNRKFTTIYNLNSHRRLHSRPCTEKCPEEGCDARFPTKRNLEAHMKTHNGDEKTYHCPYPGCNAVFYSAISISCHNRIHKEREAELRCNYEGCGKVFDRMCRLKQHMRQHTGEKPYKCTFEGCTWAFPTASKLKRHSAKHLNLRKFKCDLCDKRFMRPEHLKGHRITHFGIKPFTCPRENCDASFTAKSSLYVHLNKHNQELNNLTYHCPMDGCTRKYSSKAMLRTHLMKHYMDPSQQGDFPNHNIAQLLKGYNSDEDQAGQEVAEEMTGIEENEGDQFREGGVEFNRDQLTSAAVTQLLSLPVSISVESPSTSQTSDNTAQPADHPASESSTRRVGVKNPGGCARTDYQRNHDISKQARERWHQKRENEAQITAPVETDIYSAPCVTNSDLLGLVKQDGEIFTAPESSLAGLSYPEAGLTCVHSQLLQDDPPQTVYYSGDPIGLNGDSSDLNQSMLDMVPSHFTNTTINLNDLV